jgi:hypothetical protein
MKNKRTLLIALMLLFTTQVTLAGVTTEKDIGKCTRKNGQGYCVESATHTCFDVNPVNGYCRGWTIKNGDQFQDVMRQFQSYNQELVQPAQPTPQEQQPYTPSEKTKFEEARDTVNTGVNMLNDTANTLNAIRSIFGR